MSKLFLVLQLLAEVLLRLLRPKKKRKHLRDKNSEENSSDDFDENDLEDKTSEE